MPRMQQTEPPRKKALHNQIGCTTLNNRHRYCTHLLHSRVYSIFGKKKIPKKYIRLPIIVKSSTDSNFNIFSISKKKIN